MIFCPTCLQNVPEAHKHNILNATETNLSELEKALNLAEKERKSVMDLLDVEKKELSSLNERKNNLVFLKSRTEFIEKSISKREEIRKIRENIEKDVLLLTEHLNGIKEALLKYSTFDTVLKSKKEELRSSLQKEKNAEISIAESNKELQITRKEIFRLEALIKEKEISKVRLLELTTLIDWLSNQFLSLIDFTERNVLIKLRNEFSALFNKWFNVLAGDSFDVRIDENFTPLIIQGDIEMEYSFLSGGERTAIALAYRLALNQTINSLLSTIKTKDIIILDEPTEGFSEGQIDKMREVFDELSVSQLIIVSHEQKIEGFVANVIKIKKEDNISHLTNLFSEEYQKT